MASDHTTAPRRRWSTRLRARHMTDADLAAELADREREWDEMCAALEECGGCSGSPGEWLAERMDELQTEIGRRKPA